jgi:hypothetical protein
MKIAFPEETTSSCEFHHSWEIASRRRLHRLLLVTARGRGEVSDINIVIFLQLLQAGHDSLLDEFLALRRRGDSLSRLLHLDQGLVLWKTAQGIDENSVRLGNVESNVGDFVGDQSIQDGDDGAFNDIEGNNRSESLWYSQ